MLLEADIAMPVLSLKFLGGNYVRVWDIKERYREVEKNKEKE